MMKILRDLGTGIDGVTHDIVRWLAGGGSLTALGLTIHSVVFQNHPFDIQQFGIGFGALLGAVGAALGLKAKTEPQAT